MTQLFTNRVYSLSLLILLICIAASLRFPDTFPTFENFSQIALNFSIDAIVAVGMMLLLIAGAFDLSVGSVVALSGGLAAHLMYYYGVPVPLAVIAGLGAAGLVGCVNGFFIARQGINPMIQTLATMGIARGLALMLSGAGIQNLPYWYNAIGQSKLLGLRMPIWYMIAIVVLFTILSQKTIFFRRYYYIGGNEKAARLSGIKVEKMMLYAFIITSLLAGIAGILLSARLGAALSTSGRGLELRVITAVILGGASLSGGIGKIPGALLGAFFMGLVGNIMILARVSGYWQEIILGVILIAAVWLDMFAQRRVSNWQ